LAGTNTLAYFPPRPGVENKKFYNISNWFLWMMPKLMSTRSSSSRGLSYKRFLWS